MVLSMQSSGFERSGPAPMWALRRSSWRLVFDLPAWMRRLIELLRRLYGYWRVIAAPQGTTLFNDMCLDRRDDRLWYLATPTDGLFVTRDGGATWEQHLNGNVGTVVIDVTNPDLVYASSGADLYRSHDRGATWQHLHSFLSPDSPGFIDSLLVSQAGTAIYVGVSTTLHNARVYKSGDLGTTWAVSFDSGQRGLHIWDIAEDPISGFLYFCTEDSSYHDPSPVMRSRDRGDSWEDITPEGGPHSLNVTVHPSNHTVYLLTESSFLMKSTDSGASWASKYVDFGAVLLIDKNSPSRLFGGEMLRGVKQGGVYSSNDSGESFVYLGPSGKNVMALAVNGASTQIFAAAQDGIYQRNI